jgi:outer membrane protein insertion porin family
MGGERYATASFDLSKQVGTVLGSPVSVGAFVDIGSLWHLNRQVDTTADRNSVIRSSAGLTLTFTVAGAPVSLYVAKPIKKAPRDEEQNFGMSISLRL